ncbi:hypothetical protein [Micromonospora sp. KC213]|uniref:hypothetical protein n=1 Tax=Micromonospora sp. KC213 TaxID=2530378 RepID=UPI001044F2A1|nr:hypothetical protein [Micromonospora sp. KC213]TDC34971.1 hypothetical protein E1166_24080 [Micromonospora sp. KC213]
MSHRSRWTLTTRRLTCASLTILAALGMQAVVSTGAHAATSGRQDATQAVDPPCVRPGQAAYPVSYYWKNALGMQLGSGTVSVNTAPSLWGGQITPGGTFTVTLTHRTTQWPLLVTRYTTTWDLSSLLAYADVISQSGTGTISGNTLSITSPSVKTDPPTKVITFQVRQGTIGGSMTIRPTGISSVIAAPGQLGNNTPAPPIQIVDGQSISPTRAVNDTATTTQNTSVSVPVLANDVATSPRFSSVSTPSNGTATISGSPQELPTVPGTVMTWSLYHRGRLGTDVMQVLIGAPTATVPQTPIGATSPNISDDNTAWGFHTGVYVVPPGQTTTRFAFQSVSAAGGSPAIGNFLDGVEFRTPPCP